MERGNLFKPNPRKKRSDARVKTSLRIEPDTYNRCEIYQFQYKCSFNEVYDSMIKFCLYSQRTAFQKYMEEKYPRNLNAGMYNYLPGNDDPIPAHGFRR